MNKYPFLFILVFLTGCKPKQETQQDVTVCYSLTDTAWYSSGQKAPLFEGLAGINFPVSNTNPQVRQYINQGMMLAYGFNHAEAARLGNLIILLHHPLLYRR